MRKCWQKGWGECGSTAIKNTGRHAIYIWISRAKNGKLPLSPTSPEPKASPNLAERVYLPAMERSPVNDSEIKKNQKEKIRITRIMVREYLPSPENYADGSSMESVAKEDIACDDYDLTFSFDDVIFNII